MVDVNEFVEEIADEYVHGLIILQSIQHTHKSLHTTYKGEPSWHEFVELVINENTLYEQFHGLTLFREHVLGQLIGHLVRACVGAGGYMYGVYGIYVRYVCELNLDHKLKI
jgi:hypothetical protein